MHFNCILMQFKKQSKYTINTLEHEKQTNHDELVPASGLKHQPLARDFLYQVKVCSEKNFKKT